MKYYRACFLARQDVIGEASEHGQTRIFMDSHGPAGMPASVPVRVCPCMSVF